MRLKTKETQVKRFYEGEISIKPKEGKDPGVPGLTLTKPLTGEKGWEITHDNTGLSIWRATNLTMGQQMAVAFDHIQDWKEVYHPNEVDPEVIHWLKKLAGLIEYDGLTAVQAIEALGLPLAKA